MRSGVAPAREAIQACVHMLYTISRCRAHNLNNLFGQMNISASSTNIFAIAPSVKVNVDYRQLLEFGIDSIMPLLESFMEKLAAIAGVDLSNIGQNWPAPLAVCVWSAFALLDAFRAACMKSVRETCECIP